MKGACARWWVRLRRSCRRSRTPLILQSEVAECGLVCLVMIARFHGSRIDLTAARNRIEISARGVNLAQLTRMARQVGLEPRPLRVELESLQQVRLPCVLHWDFEHFVVLTRVEREAVTLHDPARGLRKLRLDEVSRHFTGAVLELHPLRDLAAHGPADVRPWTSLRPALAAARAMSGRLLVLTLALQTLALAGPLHLRWLVDDLLGERDSGWVLALAAGFAGIVVLQGLLGAMRGWLMAVAGARMNLALFSSVTARLLRLPMPWFQKRSVGDVLSRLESIQAIQRTLTVGLIEGLVDAGQVLLCAAMMSCLSPMLAVVALAGAAACSAARLALVGRSRSAAEEFAVHEARRMTHFVESVRGIQTVKLFGHEARRSETANHLAIEQFNCGFKAERLRLLGQAADGILSGLENVVTLSLGAALVMQPTPEGQAMTLGTLMAFTGYKLQFGQRLHTLLDQIIEIPLMGVHARRLTDITAAAPESPGCATRAAVPRAWSIELRDVSFRYASTERPVIAGARLQVAEGECVAIVGASGGGKTTVLKLMLGLLEPESGEVFVGGAALRDIDPIAWRRHVGTVMQDDILFSGTIAQNICFFESRPDVEAIEACARTAGIHDEVLAMPMAYRTRVGDMGNVLSGGQRQRLLLARALYRKPRLLMLDEATSHLDLAGESRIVDALRAMGITRIVVAHRPQTIASADRVVELRDGELRVVRDRCARPDAIFEH